MKNIFTALLLTCLVVLTGSLFAQRATVPVTALSFPNNIIDKDGGSIDFYAKLTGFAGSIPNGCGPHFFFQSDELKNGIFKSFWYMGFNSNNGAGNGGLVGHGGRGENFYRDYNCGTGAYGNWTYEDVLGAGKVDLWHHYKIVWDKSGVTDNDSLKRMSIYVDGVLNTQFWNELPLRNGTVTDVRGGVLNLICTGNGGTCIPNGAMIAIDEFKVFDSSGKLVLYNTLGSQSEIENSAVGPDGSFNGGGNAHFIPGVVGNAVEATPVYGFGALCSTPSNLAVTSITANSVKFQWAISDSSANGFIIRYKPVGTDSVKEKITRPGATSVTVKGLNPATTYAWSIRTICSDKASPWIKGTSFTTTSSAAEITATLSIAPNPVTANTITVYYTSVNALNVQLTINNLQGQNYISQKFMMSSGTLNKTIDVSALPKGVYVLKIISGRTQQQVKFVKAN